MKSGQENRKTKIALVAICIGVVLLLILRQTSELEEEREKDNKNDQAAEAEEELLQARRLAQLLEEERTRLIPREEFLEVDQGLILQYIKAYLHRARSFQSSREVSLVLVHGEDRAGQSAEYWQPLFEPIQAAFSELTWVHSLASLSFVGHGKSKEGFRAHTPSEQLSLFVEQMADGLAPNIVLIARSAGSRAVFNAIAESPELRRRTVGLVLIAPTVVISPAAARTGHFPQVPTLVVWNQQDSIAPFSRAAMFREVWRGAKIPLSTYFLDLPGSAPQRHQPEQAHPSEFAARLAQFVRTLH